MKTQIYNDTILKITRPTLKINDHVVLSENLHVVQTTTGQLSFSRLTEDQKTWRRGPGRFSTCVATARRPAKVFSPTTGVGLVAAVRRAACRCRPPLR